jgi:hypothetical protein
MTLLTEGDRDLGAIGTFHTISEGGFRRVCSAPGALADNEVKDCVISQMSVEAMGQCLIGL